jgi:hypothetical protein
MWPAEIYCYSLLAILVLAAVIILLLHMLFVEPKEEYEDKNDREHIPQHIRNQVVKRDKWKCYYCDENLKGKEFHLDHVIPWSRGGTNKANNLVVS